MTGVLMWPVVTGTVNVRGWQQMCCGEGLPCYAAPALLLRHLLPPVLVLVPQRSITLLNCQQLGTAVHWHWHGTYIHRRRILKQLHAVRCRCRATGLQLQAVQRHAQAPEAADQITCTLQILQI